MTKNQKTKLERYAELKTLIAISEKELKEIQPDVYKVIEKQGKTETPYGTFNMNKGRDTWKYSENVEAMQENVKVAMAEEQNQGIAKKVEGTPILAFTIAKI